MVFARSLLAALVLSGALASTASARTYDAGRFVLGDPITLGDGGVLAGAGRGETVLVAGGNLERMVRSANESSGTTGIVIRDLTLDCADKAGFAIRLVRASRLELRNVRVQNCRRAGIKISGGGQRTRRFSLTGIEALDNGEDGVLVQWAMRDGLYSDIYAEGNGRHGVTFDHSEFTATNVVARNNRRSGIYLRNLFGTSLQGLTATHNGEHGILLQGWVHSSGANWRAQANSEKASGRWDDIHFSGDDTLSYGASRLSSLTGLAAGGYGEFGAGGLTRHAVRIEEPVGLIVITGATFGETAQEAFSCESRATAEALDFSGPPSIP